VDNSHPWHDEAGPARGEHRGGRRRAQSGRSARDRGRTADGARRALWRGIAAYGRSLREARTATQITRNSTETGRGPSDWFTGTVYIDAIAAPSNDSRISASSVRFTPGARTAWHTRPNGQTIWVTEGVGLCQRRGGPIEVIRPGDRVFFEPGEDHWHGAAPDRFMTDIAMLEVDEGNPATWGDHVTDEEYAAAPEITS
jgi:quercetin dioxygenase-like cupin family protein